MTAARSVGPLEALSGFGIVSTSVAVVTGYSFRRVGESSWKRERRLADQCSSYADVLFSVLSAVSTLLRSIARIARPIRKRKRRGRGLYSRGDHCSACIAASICFTKPSWQSFICCLIQCCGCEAYLMKLGGEKYRIMDLKCKPTRHYSFTERVVAYGACPNCGTSVMVSIDKKGFPVHEWKYKT